MKRYIFFIILFCFVSNNAFASNNIEDANKNQFNVILRNEKANYYDEELRSVECGGVLVHRQIVATALHCVKDVSRNYTKDIWVQYPGTDKNNSKIKRRVVKKIFSLEKNNDNLPKNDIAFMVLEKPMVSHIKYKVASLEIIKKIIDNNQYVYGYGHFYSSLNELVDWSKSKQQFLISTPLRGRYVLSNEKVYFNDMTTTDFPYSINIKVPECQYGFGSGNPLTSVVNNQEVVIGILSSSNGWSCNESDKRNIVRIMIIYGYEDLLKQAITYLNF